MVTRLTSGYWPATLALAAYAAVSPYPLQAQQDRGGWTNIGPSPAAVEAIAVDPHGSGTIFMGSIAGGIRKSVDGGITWSAVNSGLTTPVVQALAMDASGPQTVYAGTRWSVQDHRWRRHVAEYPGDLRGGRVGRGRPEPVRRRLRRGLQQPGEWLDQEKHRRGSYLDDYLSHHCCDFQHND